MSKKLSYHNLKLLLSLFLRPALTCMCAELGEKNIGEEVTVMGWVQKQRNMGNIIFVDLRDRFLFL